MTDTLPLFCAWFALCINYATGWVEHPVLGRVAVCDDCRKLAEA